MNKTFSEIDFSNFYLIITKKVSSPYVDVGIQVNSNTVANNSNYIHNIATYNDKIMIEFKNKNHILLFRLEEYLYDFIMKNDYVFTKYNNHN